MAEQRARQVYNAEMAGLLPINEWFNFAAFSAVAGTSEYSSRRRINTLIKKGFITKSGSSTNKRLGFTETMFYLSSECAKKMIATQKVKRSPYRTVETKIQREAKKEWGRDIRGIPGTTEIRYAKV